MVPGSELPASDPRTVAGGEGVVYVSGGGACARPDGRPVIRFHFDFLSPYAYLGWTQIHAVARRHGRQLVPVPTLFAALLRHGATEGPASIPAKRACIFKDVLRTAHLLNVPISPPAKHPVSPVLALRAASVPEGPDQTRLTDALFAAVWNGGPGAETPEQVAAVAASVGLDGPALVAAATTPEAKERLRDRTEEAIRAGVFGVPTMRVDGELFWGVDSFVHLERFLAGSDPLAGTDMTPWALVGVPEPRKGDG